MLRQGDQQITHYLDEAAQMIYSETVHHDIICTIQPSCFFDIQEAQMFLTAAHASRRFSKL